MLKNCGLHPVSSSHNPPAAVPDPQILFSLFVDRELIVSFSRRRFSLIDQTILLDGNHLVKLSFFRDLSFKFPGECRFSKERATVSISQTSSRESWSVFLSGAPENIENWRHESKDR